MISVIIPTRNRANLLNDTLKSILNQSISLSEFEIIVVDNGSNDNTAEIINKYKDQLTNLRKIFAPEPGLHIGRHAGMKAAKGDILVFADDDIEALPTWLISIREAFKDPEVAMVGGNNYPLFLQSPPDWLNQMWKRKTIRGNKFVSELSICEFSPNTKNISPSSILGCNFPIRKSVLIESGGFHPDSFPENLKKFSGDGETYVSKYVHNKGLKCIFRHGASIFHKVIPQRMTKEYFYKRSFEQGIRNSYTILRDDFAKNKNSCNKKNFLNLMTINFRDLLTNFKKLLINRILASSMERDITEIKLKGLKEGFDYHQKLYNEELELRNWVHKEKYY